MDPWRLPTKEMLDPATGDHPTCLSRQDGHMCVCNSLALELAKITRDTPDPPGGEVVRDAKGFPTGVFKDAAMDYISRVIPKTTPEQRLRAAKRALGHAASLGVTSVQDMNPSYDDISIYADLANRGELTTRIYAAPMETGWYDQAKLGIDRPGRRGSGSAPSKGTPTGRWDRRPRTSSSPISTRPARAACSPTKCRTWRRCARA